VISEVSGALGDIGFTIPEQAWTYWNRSWAFSWIAVFPLKGGS
jgi:hypothetical protein